MSANKDCEPGGRGSTWQGAGQVANLLAANRRLQTAHETLVRADQERAEVIESICHDVRIPLTAVLCFGELLEDSLGESTDASQRAFLDGIAQNVERITTLLDELLRRTRAEGEGWASVPSVVNVGALLERTRFCMQPLADRKGVCIEVEADEPLPDVAASPVQMDQVLHNLVSNAIKFTHWGGAIRLRAFAVPSHDELVVEVLDTGVGIAAEDLPLLFQRFYRGGTLAEPGSGLGLAICKSLVEAMGGAIGVASNPGGGSRFWFTLPIFRGADDAQRWPSGAPPCESAS